MLVREVIGRQGAAFLESNEQSASRLGFDGGFERT